MNSRKDPTRTSLIVAGLIRQIIPYFNKLKKDISKYSFPQIEVTTNASADVEFKKFEKWIANQVENLGPNDDVWEKYIFQTHKKGHSRVFDDTKGISKTASAKKEFLKLTLNKPETVSKVKMLARAALNELKGVTQVMSTQMKRVLVEGLARGDNPKTIARLMVDRVDKIGITRARTIARTEIIKVHAESQLDAMESMGGTEVGFMAEWSTAGDDRVCPLCAPLEATVMKIREARGLLPRHPNCRCAYLPIAPDLKPERGQKTTRRDVQRAIDKSAKRGMPKRSTTLVGDSTRKPWKGESVKITTRRRTKPKRKSK